MSLAAPGPVSASRRRLAVFAWCVLAYNLVVIAWGAFVRATGSGAGCGRHWPLCNGEVVPRAHKVETLIEMTHRLTSGLALLLVLGLLVAVRRVTPKGDRARRAAGFSMGFIVGEALLGAGLVLFELVAHDASMKRALSMMLHLSNTFLLLGSLALTAAWVTPSWARGGLAALSGRRGLVRGLLGVALLSVLAVGASGALAALGDTLFPARSLREGIAQELSPFAHAFVRLRLLHPILAIGSGLVVVATSTAVRLLRPLPRVIRFSRALTVIFCVQLCLGLLNVRLLAPVWMQLVHLLVADVTWILLVLAAGEALGAKVSESAPSVETTAAPAL